MLTEKIKNKINIKLNIDYPDYVMEEIEYCFRDGNIENLELCNIYYKFKLHPLPCKEYPEYYWIPFYNNYVISKEAIVLDIKTNTCVLFHKTKPPKNNKKNISHGYNSNTNKKLKLHRLLALAFIDYKDNPIKPYTLYVNHINGKPGDDRIENLEWVTPRENLIHAIENGLMPNSIRPIHVKDLNTGIVTSYDSITKATIDLKWPKTKIYKRLEKNNKFYPDMLIFKYKENKWPLLDTIMTRMGSRRKVVSINLETNEIKEHETIMHAAAYTNVNTTSISYTCKENLGKPVKTFKFYFLEKYVNKDINQ